MSFAEEISCVTNLVKVVCSNPFEKSAKYHKISLRPVNSGAERLFHAEKFTKTQAFHENLSTNDVASWLLENVEGKFKQVCIFCENKTVT